MAYYPLKVKDSNGVVHVVGDPRVASIVPGVPPAGGTFTGDVAIQGADLRLKPGFTTIGTVTGVTSGTAWAPFVTMTMFDNTSGIFRARAQSDTSYLDFETDGALGSADIAKFSSMAVGGKFRFKQSGLTYIATITAVPLSISSSMGGINTFRVTWDVDPGTRSFGLAWDSTTTIEYEATGYVIATSATSISIPVSHFLVGSAAYRTDSATFSGGSITVLANPGSVAGQAVGYYSATGAAIEATAVSSATSELSFSPVRERWEIDGRPIEPGYAHISGETILTAASPRRFSIGNMGRAHLPSTSALELGDQFEFFWPGTGFGNASVRDFGDTNVLASLAPGSYVVATVASTTSELWDIRYVAPWSIPQPATDYSLLSGFSDGTAIWRTELESYPLIRPRLTTPVNVTQVLSTLSSGVANLDVAYGGDSFFFTGVAGNWTLNIRGYYSSMSLSSLLPNDGDSMTVTVAVTQGATPYYMTGLQIDGVSQTVKWVGGSAPTAGNANSVDEYKFTILKKASPNTYEVFGSMESRGGQQPLTSQHFYRGSNGSGITTGATNPYGVSPLMVANGVYQFEYWLGLANSSTGQITLGWNSTTVLRLTADVSVLPASAGTAYAGVNPRTSTANAALTGGNSAGTHWVKITGVVANNATERRIPLVVSVASGTLTPQAGSWFRFVNLGTSPSGTGNVSFGNVA